MPAVTLYQDHVIARRDSLALPVIKVCLSLCLFVPTGWAENGTIFVHLIISPNINRFSKSFHCQNQETICNKTVTTDPSTP